MKKISIHFLLGILFVSNCYAATPLTCPSRPGFITCPNNVITINPESIGWQSRINVGRGLQCTGNRDYRFKFDTAQYNSKTHTLECFYLAENQTGEIIAALSLITKNYRNAGKQNYSHWQFDADSYDCGQMAGTRLRNCPIEPLGNNQ